MNKAHPTSAIMTQQVRRRKVLGLLIASILLVAAGVALFFPIREARRAARRMSRGNSLKQVGMALHNFQDTYKCLPAAVHRDEQGRALSSWRFRILPYLEAIMQDWDYERRWDDPANLWLTGKPHWIYCLDESARSPTSPHTYIVAITGPGTAFDEDRECSLDAIDVDTILAIEVNHSGIHWAAPGDLPASKATPSLLSGVDGHGVNVLFADGVVWYVPNDVGFENLKKFFTIEGAKQADRERTLRTYSAMRGN